MSRGKSLFSIPLPLMQGIHIHIVERGIQRVRFLNINITRKRYS